MLSTQLNETVWMCVFDMLIHCSVAVEADLFSKQKCFVSVLFESNTSSHLNISLSLSFSSQAPRPSTGPHKLRECLPLIIFLRNRLKYALTGDEVKKICMQRFIKIDGKVRTDITYPAGFMGEFRETFFFLFSPLWSRSDVKPSGRGCSDFGSGDEYVVLISSELKTLQPKSSKKF